MGRRPAQGCCHQQVTNFPHHLQPQPRAAHWFYCLVELVTFVHGSVPS